MKKLLIIPILFTILFASTNTNTIKRLYLEVSGTGEFKLDVKYSYQVKSDISYLCKHSGRLAFGCNINQIKYIEEKLNDLSYEISFSYSYYLKKLSRKNIKNGFILKETVNNEYSIATEIFTGLENYMRDGKNKISSIETINNLGVSYVYKDVYVKYPVRLTGIFQQRINLTKYFYIRNIIKISWNFIDNPFNYILINSALTFIVTKHVGLTCAYTYKKIDSLSEHVISPLVTFKY